ncbi:hypothetical protein [Gilvimarinus xylanilyticus]|uniref:Uncharacterized protein n=1 Tax=Gilvimarinus xylanilyticus TaxID=2944139 RepID=A0A9X2KWB6_9GAMM|nr:hypothetical protein [Gilvimarinus xylanilyticus]MCP8898815.1 hypothetical protein [Gilvimarinus xylanilyticus]
MAPLTLLALVIITIVALAAVNAINLRQQTLKQLARRQQRLYHDLEQLEEALAASLQYVEDIEVSRQLAKEKLATLQLLLELERHNPAPLQARVEQAQTYLQNLSTGGTERQINRYCYSDVEIKAAQEKLARAAVCLHQRWSSERMDREAANQCRQQIDWATLMVRVLSLLGAAYSARDNNQNISALNYFRKVQSLLQASQHTDPRRLQLIKEIAQVIRLEKPYIDAALFPEYHALIESEEAHAV